MDVMQLPLQYCNFCVNICDILVFILQYFSPQMEDINVVEHKESVIGLYK